MLRRGLDAPRACGAGLGRLTVWHVSRLLACARGRERPPRPAPLAELAPAPATAPAPAIVLEGESGALATARFVVENLDEPISAPVRMSSFRSRLGHEVDVSLRCEPEVVNLQPREQLLVHVGTRIDEQLAGDGGCWGRLAIAALPGTELVVLVRHRTMPSAPAASSNTSTNRTRGSS